MTLKIALTLDVPDGMADPDNETGLTEEAYAELVEALGDCGFAMWSGPHRVGSNHV